MHDYGSSESDGSSEMWELGSDGDETDEVLMEDDWAEARCHLSAVARSEELSIVAGFWPVKRRNRADAWRADAPPSTPVLHWESGCVWRN